MSKYLVRFGVIFLTFFFLLQGCCTIFPMDTKVRDALYDSACQWCLKDQKKLKVDESNILDYFLSISSFEPDIDFIESIILKHPVQKYNEALRAASKNMFWNVGSYILQTFGMHITKSSIENFVKNAAFFGQYTIVKQFLPLIRSLKGLKNVLCNAISGAGNVRIVRLLLCEIDHLREKTPSIEKDYVYDAIVEGHFDLFLFFIKEFNVFEKYRTGDPMFSQNDLPFLHVAMVSKKNQAKFVNFLINDCKASVSEGDTFTNATALQYLIECNNHLNKESVFTAELILSTDGYYANEICVPFMRLQLSEDYYRSKILDLIEERQRLSKSKMYTLSGLILCDEDLSIEAVRALIEQESNQDYQRAFLCAVGKERADLVFDFLQKQKCNIAFNTKIEGIIIAIKKGQVGVFERIFEHVDVCKISKIVWKRIIRQAVSSRNLVILKYILDLKVCGLHFLLNTALKSAALNDETYIIQDLTRYRKFSNGVLNKAAMLAASKASGATVQLLFTLGAFNRNNVFWEALRKRNRDVLALFLSDDDEMYSHLLPKIITDGRVLIDENDTAIIDMFSKRGFFSRDDFVVEVKAGLQKLHQRLIYREKYERTYRHPKSIMRSGVAQEKKKVTFDDFCLLKGVLQNVVEDAAMFEFPEPPMVLAVLDESDDDSDDDIANIVQSSSSEDLWWFDDEQEGEA